MLDGADLVAHSPEPTRVPESLDRRHGCSSAAPRPEPSGDLDEQYASNPNAEVRLPRTTQRFTSRAPISRIPGRNASHDETGRTIRRGQFSRRQRDDVSVLRLHGDAPRHLIRRAGATEETPSCGWPCVESE